MKANKSYLLYVYLLELNRLVVPRQIHQQWIQLSMSTFLLWPY